MTTTLKEALAMLLDMDGPLSRALADETGRRLLRQLEARRKVPLSAARLRDIALGLQLLSDVFATIANERHDHEDDEDPEP
jgi:hypothetical protein